MRFSFLLSFLLSFSSAKAETFQVDLAGEYAGRHYAVAIMARPATVGKKTFGHTFVAFFHESDEENMSKIDGAWGFYPAEGFGVLPTDGALLSEWGVSASGRLSSLGKQTVGVVVRVTPEVYELAQSVAEKWKDKPQEYWIARTDKNCNRFGLAVAEALGLTVPSNAGVFPVDYVRAIGEEND